MPKNATAKSSSTPMEHILGLRLMTDLKTKKDTKELLRSKKIVALYFSARWSSPCQAFTPLLKTFYENVKDRGDLEIVYIGSDRKIEEFEEYFETMPWLTVGVDIDAGKIKKEIATRFRIKAIPALVILHAETGNYVTSQGRQEVTKVAKNDAKACQQLLDSWLDRPSMPLEEAQLDDPSAGNLKNFFLKILKSPVYFVAIIYGIKFFYQYMTRDQTGQLPAPIQRQHFAPKNKNIRVDEDEFDF